MYSARRPWRRAFLCYKKRMQGRYSKKREQILDVLKAEQDALSAAEVHSRLPALDLATVYRNLERFVREGVVKKLYFDNREARFEYQETPHHHAVCTECERLIHFTVQHEKIHQLIDINEFRVDEIEVTVRGKCNHS